MADDTDRQVKEILMASHTATTREHECVLCGEALDGTQRKSSNTCQACCDALDYRKRQRLLRNPMQMHIFRKTVRETGIRKGIAELDSPNIALDNPADNCPKNCTYRTTCGGYNCCMYNAIRNESKPKDCNAYTKDCKCFEKGNLARKPRLWYDI